MSNVNKLRAVFEAAVARGTTGVEMRQNRASSVGSFEREMQQRRRFTHRSWNCAHKDMLRGVHAEHGASVYKGGRRFVVQCFAYSVQDLTVNKQVLRW